MSEAEFEAFFSDEDVRAEWVNGEAILYMPVKTIHSRLVIWLTQLIGFFVAQKNLGEVLGPEVEIRLPGLRRIPDLFFVSVERQQIVKETHIEGAPDLIIEIVSADSVDRDWHDKRVEYERIGVREYWVIDPEYNRVRVFQLGTDGTYTTIQEDAGKVHSNVLNGFWIRPSDLWQDPLPNTLTVLRELGVTN
ncbi:MAG: Uma2 family endonuclease, partial [Chloroflexota bacterium]